MASTGEESRVKVKVEPQDTAVAGVEVDGGINCETEQKRQFLLTANERLRKAILKLRERQEILLEYLEVELGTEAFSKYKINRERLIYVLGYTEEDIAGGRQNEKYVRLFRLMHLAHVHWIRSKSEMHRPSNTEARLRYEANVPQQLAELRLHIDFDTGFIGRKPIKRCHTCYDESHEMKFCPHKDTKRRSGAVRAMIAQRYEKLKEEECSDPTLSKAYKRNHYHFDPVIDERKKRRQDIKQAKKEARILKNPAKEARKEAKKLRKIQARRAAKQQKRYNPHGSYTTFC